MTTASLLTPVVVSIFPRALDRTPLGMETIFSVYKDTATIALSTCPEDSSKYAEMWQKFESHPLLILRTDPAEQITVATAAVLELTRNRKGRAVGIVIMDGPDMDGFYALYRAEWNEAFARAAHSAFLDVQVLEYSSSWKYAPPRIR